MIPYLAGVSEFNNVSHTDSYMDAALVPVLYLANEH